MDNDNNNINNEGTGEDFEAEYEKMMSSTEYSSGKIIDVDINLINQSIVIMKIHIIILILIHSLRG